VGKNNNFNVKFKLESETIYHLGFVMKILWMTECSTSLVLYMSTAFLCLVDMKFCKNLGVGVSYFIIQWKWPNCKLHPRSTFYSTAAISNI